MAHVIDNVVSQRAVTEKRRPICVSINSYFLRGLMKLLRVLRIYVYFWGSTKIHFGVCTFLAPKCTTIIRDDPALFIPKPFDGFFFELMFLEPPILYMSKYIYIVLIEYLHCPSAASVQVYISLSKLLHTWYFLP